MISSIASAGFEVYVIDPNIDYTIKNQRVATFHLYMNNRIWNCISFYSLYAFDFIMHAREKDLLQ